MKVYRIPVDKKLWLQGVGEHYHDKNWRLLLGSLREGVEVKRAVEVELIPEPSNPHDGNAVKMVVEGCHLGYLPAEIAKLNSKQLLALEALGVRVAASGTIWAVRRGKSLNSNVAAHIPNVLTFPTEHGFIEKLDEYVAPKRPQLPIRSFLAASILVSFLAWIPFFGLACAGVLGFRIFKRYNEFIASTMGKFIIAFGVFSAIVSIRMTF
jgi:hypothetical protein